MGVNANSIETGVRCRRTDSSVVSSIYRGKVRIGQQPKGHVMTMTWKPAMLGLGNLVLAALFVVPAIMIDTVRASRSRGWTLDADWMR
jgi:hypothetical protein